MGIEKIEIENYKSIKKCNITFKQLNLIIGENGSGKTNVISAIKYFYDSLIGIQNENEMIFDKNNKFSNQVRIAITYDCTELKKIVVHKLNVGEEKNIEYYRKVINLIGKNNKIYVELIKIKEMPIKWNIKSYSDREILYNIFPFYYVETRDINFKSWERIWEDIGDYLKLEKTNEIELQKKLLENIDDKENIAVSKKLKYLQNIFDKSEIQVQNYTPKQYATAMAQMYFKGENFQISQHKPNYFSDGTNSFNYINILIDIISIIKINKIKFPVIIIDEPEISLHHKYIDKISEKIIENDKSQYIIATHSARLLKNILRDNKETNNIIHLKYENKYTICSHMKLFDDERQNTVINDEHASSYFANMLLLVEGESELQLFNNYYLKEIFPILKNIDIIKAATDNVIKKGLLPDERNYSIPYLIIIDMDKVMVCKPKENKFVPNKKDGYFKEYKKEKYYYSDKRLMTYQLRKRIKGMMEKCRFHYILPFYSCTDNNYYELIKNIKEYFLQYNIFVNSTTIEGVLINEYNMDKFWKFYNLKYKPSEELKYYYLHIKTNDQVNLLRLLVSGKTDYILNLKQLDKIRVELKELIEKNKITQKTEGWISEWIKYYLCDVLKITEDEEGEKQLRKHIKKEEIREICKFELYNDFPELINIFREITKRFSN